MIIDEYVIIKGNKVLVKDLPIKSNVLLNYKCDNCGKVGKRKAESLFKSKYDSCCMECRSKLRILQSMEQLEYELNVPDFKSYIENLYINELKSIREISLIIYGNSNRNHTIYDYLNYFNIPLRCGSEAVKTQYIGEKGIIRKKMASKNSIKGINSVASREKLKKTMQTIEYKTKQSISKLGEKNGMYGLKGESNPLWNANKTREQRIKDRKLPQTREWRINVFKRDKYMCQCCKGTSKNLNAHHLNGYHWFVEGRFNVENGITLCEDCHKQFHKLYGMRNNTKEQFEEFKVKYKNDELALAE